MTPLDNDRYSALIESARQAVVAIPAEEFAGMLSDDVADAVHPEIFGDACLDERFSPYTAADISDTLYEGISLAYWNRKKEEEDL